MDYTLIRQGVYSLPLLSDRKINIRRHRKIDNLMLVANFQSLSQREQLNLTYKEGTLLYTKATNQTMHSLYYMDSNFVSITYAPTLKGWFTSWEVQTIRCYLDMPSNTFCLDEFIAEYSVDDLMK